MDIGGENKCVKIALPNGKVADILSRVTDEMKKWIQDTAEKPESGGYIVGYQHKDTGNISLEDASHPFFLDEKNRVRFAIRDPQHYLFLKKAKRQKSYYMGVWHTHPQCIPVPSAVDWEDWNATMNEDRTGCQYVFFIIAGIKEWRVWVGDYVTGKIVEVNECEKTSEGIYMKEGQLWDEEKNSK